MTVEPVDAEAVALAVADVLKVLEPEPAISRASVSGIAHGTLGFRVAVGIDIAGVPTHGFRPAFKYREDAEAYREAVTVALDRAT